jgi:hypothetical protein
MAFGRGPRLDLCQRFGERDGGDFGVVRRLGAQPVAVRQAEELAEPQVGVGGDGALAGDDLADPLGGNADLLGQPVLGEAEGGSRIPREAIRQG